MVDEAQGLDCPHDENYWRGTTCELCGYHYYNDPKRDKKAMKFSGWLGGSCAAIAIGNLGNCKGPEDAMKVFCKAQLILDNSRYGGGVSFNTLYTFYTFIAGPEKEGHYHSKTWVKYGTEFAAFLKKEKLGHVVTLPKKLNAKHHPDTTCQVWLWGPDQKAVEKWWKVVGSKL